MYGHESTPWGALVALVVLAVVVIAFVQALLRRHRRGR
jgi:hypothetical protein